ncbi:DUF6119 family protein [Flagellimonas flava]|uniref:Sporadically distributed protein, TIGR04141 family n=1 Tax=Flagellimonas flava TaxID=570519 RepID=A0A1M5NJ81_9FLAO|nr:DUF6119 family protein [Allomuricauda flava]SHG89562.1 sporadically distributed protein, TIGR04141 family [Allomuricauda flava]
MSRRVNAKLYKLQDIVVENYAGSEELVAKMIDEYREKSGNQFVSVTLNANLTSNGYTPKLYVYRTQEKNPKWVDFLSEIVANENDLGELEAKYSSFILFLYSENRIYAITKGYFGRYILEELMDRFFGLEVLSRLVNKSETEIRQIEERGVFGEVLGAERYFRENYNLSYEDDFGKIYKKMLASIKEENFEKLGIVKKRDDIRKVSVNGSSSIEMSTNFDYNELLQRVLKIEELLELEGVQFNQFYRLSMSELGAIRDNLNEELIKMAYNSYMEGESIDFYHPDVFEYMRSIEARFNVDGDYLEISYAYSIGFTSIISQLVAEDKIDSSTEATFLEGLQNCYGGYKITEDGAYLNEVSLDKWIGGEVEFDGNKFFKIDNDWYRYRDGFDDHLNTYFSEFDFDAIVPDYKLEAWDLNLVPKEGGYNDEYKNVDNFIVTDTKLLNQIEICDLIRISEDSIYLYHVKKDLGRDLRVLSNQIVNAARILKSAINESDNALLKKYYSTVSKNYEDNEITYNRDDKSIPVGESDFIDLFKTKTIVFVFSYSSASDVAIKEEIIATNSRIAKLSLLYCMRDMRSTNFSFLIERISQL